MHDPCTVAHEIKAPWKRSGGYRPPLVTIWHVDPQSDGSDDSCGYSSPRLTEQEIHEVKKVVASEFKYWFVQDLNYCVPKTSAEAVVYDAFQVLAWRVFKKQIKPEQLPGIFSLIYSSWDNFTSSFASEHLTYREVERTCFFIARAYKRMNRKWYQHPKWHFWHWRVNISFISTLKRFLFSRCCICHKGFRWGETVCTNQWEHGGPQWFRSEKGVFHMACDCVNHKPSANA
jgi:hypothetical protein